RIRRNDHVILAGTPRVHRHEQIVGEIFGIDDRLAAGAADVGEDLEDRAHAHVVAVGRHAVGDLAGAFAVFIKRLDADEFADLGVTENGHDSNPTRGWPTIGQRRGLLLSPWPGNTMLGKRSVFRSLVGLCPTPEARGELMKNQGVSYYHWLW